MCYYYPALVGAQQLLKAAVSEFVPALHRRDCIEALGIVLNRFIGEANTVMDDATKFSSSTAAAKEAKYSLTDTVPIGPGAQNMVLQQAHNTTLVRIAALVKADGSVARTPQHLELDLDASPLLLAHMEHMGVIVPSLVREVMLKRANKQKYADASQQTYEFSEFNLLHQRLTLTEFQLVCSNTCIDQLELTAIFCTR